MDMTLTTISRFMAAVLVGAAAGCSMMESVGQTYDSRRAVERAEAARDSGEYSAALKSYMEAERLLRSARESGYSLVAREKELEAVRSAMDELQGDAESEGLVRVGDSYVGEEELDASIGGSLQDMFQKGRIGSIAQERVVADSITADARKMPDGRYDIKLSVVLKDAGGEADFPQDAWGVVRFMLEGGYGYGFSHHLTYMFPPRPWMGKEASWGILDRRNVENYLIGLDGKIEALTISVYRGRYRKGLPEGYGPHGFKTLEAVGPYWRKEHFKSYSLEAAGAKRLNWKEARRIPDATIYGLLTIRDRETAGEDEPE
jgi:hypothetical protein